MSNPWDTTQIENDTYYQALVAQQELWVRRMGGEWLLHRRAGKAEPGLAALSPSQGPPTEGVSTERWVGLDKMERLSLTPVMPDKPVVIRPQDTMRIPGGATALIYVGIPCWIRVGVSDPTGGSTVLKEIPTQELSNTWFGLPAAGESCYSLRSGARSRYEPAMVDPWRVVCPVSIKNDGTDELEFQRLAVHVEFLPVLAGSQSLWTRGVEVSYRGGEKPAQIDIATADPKHEPIISRLSEPRSVLRRNMLHKSVSLLKSVGGMF